MSLHAVKLNTCHKVGKAAVVATGAVATLAACSAQSAVCKAPDSQVHGAPSKLAINIKPTAPTASPLNQRTKR